MKKLRDNLSDVDINNKASWTLIHYEQLYDDRIYESNLDDLIRIFFKSNHLRYC